MTGAAMGGRCRATGGATRKELPRGLLDITVEMLHLVL